MVQTFCFFVKYIKIFYLNHPQSQTFKTIMALIFNKHMPPNQSLHYATPYNTTFSSSSSSVHHLFNFLLPHPGTHLKNIWLQFFHRNLHRPTTTTSLQPPQLYNPLLFLPPLLATCRRQKMDKLCKRNRTKIQRVLAFGGFSQFSSSWVHFQRMQSMEKDPNSTTLSSDDKLPKEEHKNIKRIVNILGLPHYFTQPVGLHFILGLLIF